MKQTAVEWLVSKLYDYPMDDIVMRRIKEAKAMEKEQITDVFIEVAKTTMETFNINCKENDIEDFRHIAEEYYNETFKK